MRIGMRLQLNVVLSVVTAIIVCLVLAAAFYRLNSASNATKFAGDVLDASFERVTLRNDFVQNNSARAKNQWYASHRKVERLLRSAPQYFRDAEDLRTVRRLTEANESLGNIFSSIVANREKKSPDPGSALLSRETEVRLLNQLNMRVYEIVVNNRKLLASARVARAEALRLAGAGIVFALLSLIGTAMINSRRLGRAITDRAGRLREGAAIIGGGELRHRIDLRGDDEFADLAESINAMASRLSVTYDSLEREIAERKRAEKEVKRLLSSVREEKERLSCLVNGISDEVWFADTNGTFTLANPSAAREFSLGSSYGDVSALAASLEVYRGDGSPRPVEEAPPLRALSGEVIRDEEEIIRTPGRGASRHRQVSAAPVRNANGEIIGSVSVVRDITDRKLAEQTLREAHDELLRMLEERTRDLREKEVLLKEIHHRVKNNLQVISSLVSLQAGGSGDETVREVLKDVTDRVRSMALVHEKLYQSPNLASIDFAEYCRSLIAHLWRSHGVAVSDIRLTLELSPVSLPVDKAVPLGLILNELAGNALKHAFKGRSMGEVVVELRESAEGNCILSVRDNGIGLPEGLDWRQAKSLGLRLVQMLAGQLDAGIEVNCGEWTKFEVSFKQASPFESA